MPLTARLSASTLCRVFALRADPFPCVVTTPKPRAFSKLKPAPQVLAFPSPSRKSTNHTSEYREVARAALRPQEPKEMVAPEVPRPRVGFFGAGQMCEALARGFLSANVADAADMKATDISEARRQVLGEMGIYTTTSNIEVAKGCNVLFVAVKPNVVRQVLDEVKSVLSPDTLVVSIAAGVTLSTLQEAAGGHGRVVRVMPNVATLVGETAAAMSMSPGCSEQDEAVVKRLFDAVGVIHKVDEKLLDAVTGLSGSGPAYVFILTEALADGGVRAGLPRDVAMSLAAQTMMGSAKMILETGKHPGALKDMVTSPGGTTIAGVHALETHGVRGAIMDAVSAAANRATELSKL
mmetsp:Transcript_26835/g.51114  ORF Transcript_26835/g.51114 Transcript_26835/m.51114 type:complete len:351 (+) Transcript_26835:65-1117(+)